ncbi:hypothetical protein GCM10022243_16310 [Saccharothrix violaceirubra]|uniref:Uncharacterized protein n=1 Tax=Saccharothrix violaceirubra TaxID=413306 RepID=A0A7W7T6W6_9PSEU|nr:hypothetical protein [Saccharothrix violaceirubra]MBB4967679.1 hypothetical protein [Saccharothrix violaceirubra]
MTSSEIVELRRTLGRLRQCVGGMRARYGDIAAVRRLVNDLERLDIDVTELGELDDAPRPREAPRVGREVVVVPEAPYDPRLWHDADDEGLGGYRRT